jgi:ABC-type branched-subunit amino acid transport system permease subunit
MNRRSKLLQRTGRNLLWALVVIALALIVGMVGYVSLGPDVNGKDITWAAAFADSAMLLAGEGPLDQLATPAGQIFEGVYALVCGFIFFAAAGFALAPAFHHVLRSFHLEDEKG